MKQCGCSSKGERKGLKETIGNIHSTIKGKIWRVKKKRLEIKYYIKLTEVS